MTLACLHQDLVLTPWAHVIFFLTWYLWIPNVQFRVLWKTSSLNVSHCAFKVTVRLWHHVLDVSVPHLYNRNDTTEVLWRGIKVCKGATVICKGCYSDFAEKSQNGKWSPCIWSKVCIKKYRPMQEKKGLNCCSFLASSHQVKWGRNPLGKKYWIFILNEVSPTGTFLSSVLNPSAPKL